MELSIIIVSWNVKDLLAQCLNSIEQSGILAQDAQPSAEIIIVDSGSTDGTVEMVQQSYPQVQLLAQSENIGFTRANNIGLQAAKGHYLLLLNPDTEVIDHALQEIIAYMDTNPQVGIVGPHTLNSDGTTQSTRRRFPTRMLAFFESTWLQPYTPKSMLNHYYVVDQDDTGTFDVDWVQGSAMMVRREVYEQTGGLDEGYTMYSEEMDWCHRAKDAGWRVVYLGTAQIIHHGGKSSDQAGAWKHIYFQKSKIRYFEKYHGKAFAAFLRFFLKLNYRWQIFIERLKQALGHKPDMRRDRIAAYREVLRSGL
ncbi:glycosyltransferase family 2 protein [Phototrophicus methaneseepsis]|uniref:Glycosyltransferase family 2 protein n=1 Tax=Phototrophicus methaneseepsis TaxID=2710758 RepID=A0A7S8IDJ8_9CHLR|nr:glycosyltransferase family 2 protein [Phototrophicus methaneseepsis]QPC80878.1 glycosyltransferase family 2 protein [Phototrophicus methaneseepsis]